MNDSIHPSPPLDPAAPSRLLLLRHAEVEARYQGVFGGRIDMNLSPLGQQQAVALARFLHRIPLDALYASPMRRVQQTLAPVLQNGTPRPVILEALREFDFGDWTGLAFGEVQARFHVGAEEWLNQLECAGIPNAECAQTLRARMEPCLRQILARHPGQRVAIACHGGVIRMLLAILLELPLSKMAAFEIDYASVTQVLVSPRLAQIELLNFAPWREFAA